MLNGCDPRVTLLTAKDEVPGVSSATLTLPDYGRVARHPPGIVRSTSRCRSLANAGMTQFLFFLRALPNQSEYRAKEHPSNPILRHVSRAAGQLPYGQPRQPDAKASNENGSQLDCTGSDLRPRPATNERFRHDQAAMLKRVPNGGRGSRRTAATGGHPQFVPKPPPQADQCERHAEARR